MLWHCECHKVTTRVIRNLVNRCVNWFLFHYSVACTNPAHSFLILARVSLFPSSSILQLPRNSMFFLVFLCNSRFLCCFCWSRPNNSFLIFYDETSINIQINSVINNRNTVNHFLLLKAINFICIQHTHTYVYM